MKRIPLILFLAVLSVYAAPGKNSVSQKSPVLHFSFDQGKMLPDLTTDPEAVVQKQEELSFKQKNSPRRGHSADLEGYTTDASEVKFRSSFMPEKGQAVTLKNRQEIFLKGEKLFDPHEGTFTIWFKAENWKFDEPNYVLTFLDVKCDAYQYRMTLQKTLGGSDLFVNVTLRKQKCQIHFYPKWSSSEWHRLDLVWEPTKIRLYVDGAMQTDKSEQKYASGFPTLPTKLLRGTIGIHTHHGWKTSPNWITSLDDVKLYNKALSTDEIEADYEAFKSYKRKMFLQGKKIN